MGQDKLSYLSNFRGAPQSSGNADMVRLLMELEADENVENEM